MNNGTTRYLGLDVHKAIIAVAVADTGSHPTLYGTIANDPSAVRKLVRHLGRGAKLSAAYEAGPTGYALHRQLVGLGVECQFVAPALIPRRAGDRVKTDGRDAMTAASKGCAVVAATWRTPLAGWRRGPAAGRCLHRSL